MTYSQIKLLAEDISCDHCAMAIRRELKDVEGVRVIDVDVPSKTVTLEYADQVALTRAMDLLRDIGYPVETVVR
jgi:copper chaperone